MKENGENMWLKNLPTHAPPEGMWERLEIRMDNNLANERFRAQLAGLPEHEPPFGLWARIEQGLTRRRVFRIGIIASGIAATLLTAFVLNGLLLPEPTKIQTAQSIAKGPIENRSSEIDAGTPKQNGTFDITGVGKQKTAAPKEILPTSLYLIGRGQSTSALQDNHIQQDITFPSDYLKLQRISFVMLPLKMKDAMLPSVEQHSLSLISTRSERDKKITMNDTLSTWLLARNSKDNFPPPPTPAATKQSKGVSIGFNYLPEPMSKSDYGSSAYQTLALMAQYQMPSVDIRTGLGISYQTTPIEYSADYVSFSSSSGKGNDTIINNGITIIGTLEDAGTVNISGKERSSFLYYTIGAGKRIYSNKRISTTLRAGAGFSLLLTNQDKQNGPVYEALRNQSNTFFTNTESNIPNINQTHFDLVTSFDFNYRLHKRWSLSLEPALKYYFNPIYNGKNSRSFSTGLRTGILFKL